MDKSVNKNTLFESFAGRATPLQKKLIETWLLEPAHRELYYEWLDEWENQFVQFVPDTDEALRKSLLQTAQIEQVAPALTIQKKTKFFSRNFRWLAVAAGVFMLLSLSLFLGKDYILYQTYKTGYGEMQKIQLSDGSLVNLNANSSLKVARFGNDTREVLLSGEANFSVTHTADHKRFVVKTEKNFEVEVLGTEFNVYARQKDAKVVLNKGKVQLNYQEGATTKQLTMKPGDLVTLDQKGHANIRQIAQPQNYSAWKEHRFIFEKTALTDVAHMMNEIFGIAIEFKDEKLANRTLTGTFHAENADELLQVISELLEINFNRQNDKVTFFE